MCAYRFSSPPHSARIGRRTSSPHPPRDPPLRWVSKYMSRFRQKKDGPRHPRHPATDRDGGATGGDPPATAARQTTTAARQTAKDAAHDKDHTTAPPSFPVFTPWSRPDHCVVHLIAVFGLVHCNQSACELLHDSHEPRGLCTCAHAPRATHAPCTQSTALLARRHHTESPLHTPLSNHATPY